MSSSPPLPSFAELIDQAGDVGQAAPGPSFVQLPPANDSVPPPPQPPRSKLPTYNSIEYPGYISPNPTSINRAIHTLGGQKAVSKAFTEGGKILELKLQPDNPFAHPVTGDVVGTNKLLVKVVVRRPKRDEPEPGGDELTSADGAGPSGDKGKGKEQPEGEGTYTAEVVGLVPRTVRFRSMADFQYQPDEDDYIVQMRRAMDRLDVDAIRSFELKPLQENYEEGGKSLLELVPPPLFSRQGIPQHYNLKQNPMSVIHSTVDPRTGEETRRYIHKHQIKGSCAPAAVSWDNETVPTSPPQQILDAKPQTKPHLIVKLKQLFEQRPVWSRIALINQFPALEGREIQKADEGGYNSYQRVYFRNTANEEARRKSIVGRRAGGTGDNAEVVEAPPDDRRSHIFDGRTLHSGAASFQLCDITDSLLVPLINDEKSIADGWYTSHEFSLIKAVVRRKHFNLLQGKIIEDKDCADLFVPGGLTSSNTMVRAVSKKYLRKAKSNRRPVAPERLMAAELEIALRKGGEGGSSRGKEPARVEESEGESGDAMEEE
ncbi:tau 95 subunit of transcription factor TFIIIC [Ceratobasidium sp. 423]|nr:tau 95 subunit of transcription factor TFIIIC [Ceratobasidium sp. 423]